MVVCAIHAFTGLCLSLRVAFFYIVSGVLRAAASGGIMGVIPCGSMAVRPELARDERLVASVSLATALLAGWRSCCITSRRLFSVEIGIGIDGRVVASLAG